jgi:hypothetical protein
VDATPVQLAADLFTYHRAVFKKVFIQHTHPEVLVENLGALNHGFD